MFNPQSTASSFGSTQSSSIFGGNLQPGVTGSIFGGVQPPATGAGFGGTANLVFDQSGLSSVFGQTSQINSFNMAGEQSMSAFGKSDQVRGSYISGSGNARAFNDVEQNASQFGSFGEMVNTSVSSSSFSGSKDSSPQNLIGKTATASSGAAPIFKSVFSASESKKDSLQSSVSTHPSDKARDYDLHSGSSVLGKPMDKVAKPVSGMSGRKDVVLFGKPVPITKPSDQVETNTQLRSSPQKLTVTRKAPAPSSGAVTRGLFGKAISAVGSGQSDRRTVVTTAKALGNTDGESQAVPRSIAQRVSRRLSVEELSTKTGLIVKNIHPQQCNNSYLRKHFEKFGHVKRVYTNPEKRQATVHFATHDEAAAAKTKGRNVGVKKPPLHIFWSNYSPAGKETARRLSKEKPPLSELDDELSSMSGTDDITEERVRSLTRPEQVKRLSGGRDFKRATMSEPSAPQFPVKKSSSPAPASPQRPVRQTVGLSFLKSAVAKTTSERLELLIQYDKLVRQGINRQTNLQKAKVVVGTCQDMCPEKERYLREDRRRVHHYETMPTAENVRGQNPLIDHSRAVKEYSRASADQDEPLPHELRPVPILDMSMTYLLNNIMDEGGEGKWRDWYEFLWDRTRGIRKDITQQNLCDITSAGLVEKCARFHIFAAERLCEEDAHTFDVKINNENLTKCLQTLKELYSDLYRNGEGVTCPNEAEFRAYMVLMNLNEGDILREVQNLRQEVRDTPFIRFVVQVYSALNSNNYVKFFKLTKKASFMMACIMHRYFNQVRSRALRTMLRAFTVGKQSVNVPVQDLVQQLAFEDGDEASAFCVHHGFVVTDGQVQFERSRFINPETAFEPRRAEQLVESKLQTSVGEAVNGGPLPPNVIHHPTSSFDETGRFVRDVSSLSETSYVSAESCSVIQSTAQEWAQQFPADNSSESTLLQRKQVSNELVKYIAKDLFLEVIQDMCQDVGNSLVNAIKMYMGSSSWILDDVTLETCTEMTREIAKQVVVVEQLREKERQAERDRLAKEVAAEKERQAKEVAAEKERRAKEAAAKRELLARAAAERERQAREAAILAATRERACTSLAVELESEVVDELVKSTADEKYSEVQTLLKWQSEAHQTILEGTVDDVIHSIAQDVFETDVVQRLQLLAEREASIKLLRTAHCFRQWRNALSKMLRKKKSMYSFPCTPNVLGDGGEVLNALLPDREMSKIECGLMPYNKRARLVIESPGKARNNEVTLSRALSAYYFLNLIQSKMAWSPLDLTEIVGPQLMKHTSATRSHWKLLLSLPNQMGDDTNTSVLCDWICSKFSRGRPSGELNTDFSRILAAYSKVYKRDQANATIGVCVRTLQGALSSSQLEKLEESSALLGTAAIMFVLPSVGDSVQCNEVYWQSCQSRLKDLMDTLPPHSSLPLVVVTTSGCVIGSLQSLASSLRHPSLLNLDAFVGNGLSGYEVLALGENLDQPEATELLKESVKWLSCKSPTPPTLVSKPIWDFVEELLAAEFYTPIYQDLARRRQEGLLHQPPDVLIDLYNSVVRHLQAVACSDVLLDLSWPIPELCTADPNLPQLGWNSAAHLQYLLDVFESLTLPEFTCSNDQSDSWAMACDDVRMYLGSVCYGQVPAHLGYRVDKLLSKAERVFDYTCLLTCDEVDCTPCYLNIPWTEVISACVHHLLTSCPSTTEDGDPLMIHFLPEDYDSYITSKSWLFASALGDVQDITLDDTILYCAKRKEQEIPDLSTPTKMKRLGKCSESIPLDVQSQDSLLANEISRELANKIAEEKQQSDLFDKMLQNALNESEDLYSEAPPQSPRDYLFNGSPIGLLSDKTLMNKTGTKHSGQRCPQHIQVDGGENLDGGSGYDESLGCRLDMLRRSLETEKSAERLFGMKLQRLVTE